MGSLLKRIAPKEAKELQNTALLESSRAAAKVLDDRQRFAYAGTVWCLLEQRKRTHPGWDEDGWATAHKTSLLAVLNLPGKKSGQSVADTLTTLAENDDGQAMSDTLLADGKQMSTLVAEHLLVHSLVSGAKPGYDARARQLIKDLCGRLEVPWEAVVARENMIAHELLAKKHGEDSSSDKPKHKSAWANPWRLAAVGSATLVGGVVLAVTGGLAAPLVIAGVSGVAAATVGGGTLVTAALAVLGSSAGLALVSGLFGASGAGLAGYKMAKRTADISDFHFNKLGERDELSVCIAVSGWVKKAEDYERTWESIARHVQAEVFALEWETDQQVALCNAIHNMVTKEAIGLITGQILAQTILAPIMAAVLWPAYLVKAAGVIDNPWSVMMNRSEKCGQLLAEVLANRVQGSRPVTLIGYSMGGRALYFCLEELVRRKEFGIVENCFIVGAPLQATEHEWKNIARAVGGRLVNAYAQTDYVLGFVMRLSTLPLPIAGLRPSTSPYVENADITDIVPGHLAYRQSETMAKILARLNVDGRAQVPAEGGKATVVSVDVGGLEHGETTTVVLDSEALAAAAAAATAASRATSYGTASEGAAPDS